jgi:hypothetical protein
MGCGSAGSFEELIVIASNALHSPWGIAFNESQRMAIEADPTFKDDHADAGSMGMRAARPLPCFLTEITTLIILHRHVIILIRSMISVLLRISNIREINL